MEKLDFEKYQKLAMRTCKKHETKKDMMTDFALGLSGESGEVADMIKKELSGSKKLDPERLKEELGDVLWYLAEASEWLGVSLEELARKNIEKLSKRHPEGFSGYGKREEE